MMPLKCYNDRKSEAKRISLSERQLSQLCADSGFPFIRLGGRVLFDPDLSDEYLSRRVHLGRAAELASAT